MNTYVNPVGGFDTPDPFITYDLQTGYYYALFTRITRLEIFRSRQAGRIISDGDSRVIYTPNGERDGIWGDIWAPEMHRGSDGKWYIYTSGRIKPEPSEKRVFIMRCESQDPFLGEWTFCGMPTPDTYSIDPSVYTAEDGMQYICTSRVDERLGQVLDIMRLENPYTVTDECATVACAELEWELVPPYDVGRIVEGGFFLKRGERLFLIYSANGCWSDDYCLGVLEHTGGAICDAGNWIKHKTPLFTKGGGVFGPGHASFFTSPDGTEVFCAYHAMKHHNADATPAERYFNIQRIDFDECGFPVMGEPTGYGVPLKSPSGEACE
ncbi:MAG: family 43 glycosylhydrolase [Clostridia bacterium]|nr:family 43 glycosylhydrolase [Clostridia bacterium]